MSPAENAAPKPEPSRIISYPNPAEQTKSTLPDLSAGAPEQFPIAAFPDTLRAVAVNMTAVYQTPLCLPAMSALAVLSGAVGASVIVTGAYKDKRTRLNLYVWPVAERGSGKGVIGETLCAPVARRSKELAKQHRQVVAGKRGEIAALAIEAKSLASQVASAQGSERDNLLVTLSNRHEHLAELEAEAAREKSLLVGDVTSEALGRALDDNDEVLFGYSSEAGAAVSVALGKYSKQGQSDYDLLLSGYSGDSVRSNRITRGSVELENPCLSVLWLVQGCVMQRILGHPETTQRGLTARPLIFDTGSRREKDDRSTATFEQEESWNTVLSVVLDRRLGNNVPAEIVCSPEAREVFSKFHDESIDLERGPFADLTGELSRWRENAIKVAGLFAVVEPATTISAALAERAVSVVRWCGYNYLGLLQSGRRERQREELERVQDVLQCHGGQINLGKLDGDHGINRARLNAIMAANPGELEIVQLKTGKAGRPAEVLRHAGKSI